jgi:hypothetical protein
MATTLAQLRSQLESQLEAIEDAFTLGLADVSTTGTLTNEEIRAYEDVLADIRSILGDWQGSSIRSTLTSLSPVALLTSAARTADTETSLQTGNVGKGLVLIVDITAGTGTIDAIEVKGVNEAGADYTIATLTPDSAIGGAAGRHVFVMVPNPADFTTELKFAAGGQGQLPPSWKVNVDHTDTTSVTYTLDGFILV